MVEIRNENKSPIRKVYCCKKSDQNNFFNLIKIQEQINNIPNTLCYNHSTSCKNEGICIIPLEVVDNEDSIESPHFWYSFKSMIPSTILDNISNGEEFEQLKLIRYSIKTELQLPYSYMGILVKKYDEEKVNIINHINKMTKKTIKIFEQLIKDFKNFFLMTKDSFKDQPEILFGNDLNRFKDTILNNLIIPNSTGDFLKKLFKINSNLTNDLINPLIIQLTSCLSLYKRAVSELTQNIYKEEHQIHYNSSEKVINEFIEYFNIKPIINQDLFKGLIDPMTIKFDFENEF